MLSSFLRKKKPVSLQYTYVSGPDYLSEKSGSTPTTLFPQFLVDAFKKRLGQFLGLTLFGIGLFVLLSLLGYSPKDNAANFAGYHETSNWFGPFGAYTSDFLFQLWGWAAFILPLILLVWASVVFFIGSLRKPWRRALAVFFGSSFFAAFLSTLPAKPDLLASETLGGAGGEIFANAIGFVLPLPTFLFVVVSFGLGCLFTALALPLRISEWRQLGQKISAGIGWISTLVFTTKREDEEFLDRQEPAFSETAHESEPKICEDVVFDPLEQSAVVLEESEEEGLGNRTSQLTIHDANFENTATSDNIEFSQVEEFDEDDEAHGEDEADGSFDAEEEFRSIYDDLEDDIDKFNGSDQDLDTAPFDDDFDALDETDETEQFMATPAPAPVSPARPVPGKQSASVSKATKAKPKATSYVAPKIDYLTKPDPLAHQGKLTKEQMRENAEMLESVLKDFGVKGEIVNVWPGPVVTLYELLPSPGTKTARVVGLADDIARSMSALSARIAVVPGRNAIGIELPNENRETVYLREILSSDTFQKGTLKLPLALGKDIGGKQVAVDLAKMPHLLIAGTTGSGKSVAVNTMILSLLYHLSPEQCKFIMIDPKMLELSVYDGIPHLLSPVVIEPGKAIVALKWAVREMENRYKSMSSIGVRNIDGFNKRLEQARKNGEVLTRKVQTGFDVETGHPVYEEQEMDLSPLPFIVVVIDEMADLMLVAGKEIEATLQRLAQMARAAGIHLIMATQRPSVDVITGTIKANFPSRISFHVTSKIDSRTILGEMGAEQLLGQGDMLYMPSGSRIKRVHGPFVSDDEVETIVTHLKELGEPAYIEGLTDEAELAADGPSIPGMPSAEPSGDDLYDQAVALVLREKKASTSFVQRYLQIGYNRAARLIEKMETEGLISAADRVGRRKILVGNEGEEI